MLEEPPPCFLSPLYTLLLRRRRSLKRGGRGELPLLASYTASTAPENPRPRRLRRPPARTPGGPGPARRTPRGPRTLSGTLAALTGTARGARHSISPILFTYTRISWSSLCGPLLCLCLCLPLVFPSPLASLPPSLRRRRRTR